MAYDDLLHLTEDGPFCARPAHTASCPARVASYHTSIGGPTFKPNPPRSCVACGADTPCANDYALPCPTPRPGGPMHHASGYEPLDRYVSVSRRQGQVHPSSTG